MTVRIGRVLLSFCDKAVSPSCGKGGKSKAEQNQPPVFGVKIIGFQKCMDLNA